MSFITQISPLLDKIKMSRVALGDINFTTTQKVMLWSIGVFGTSIVAVGVLSRYLARRRARPIPNSRLRKIFNKRLNRMRSPSGGFGSVASSGGGGRSASPSVVAAWGAGTASDRLSFTSGSVASAVHGEVDVPLTPQQLGVMGMEALETSIGYWEDALDALGALGAGVVFGVGPATTSREEAELCRELQDLLHDAYALQERSELLFLDQRSVLFRSESGVVGGVGGSLHSHASGRESHLHSQYEANNSSAESFASAEDQVADLREFDEFSEFFPDVENLELYQTALKQLEIGIPCRKLRTEVTGCGSDAEFLCKLHCVRLASQALFRQPHAWGWLLDAGRQLLTDLLLFADKEPKEFLVAYEQMVSFSGSPGASSAALERELARVGVRAITFYDLLLDFVLLDAFDDLHAPPPSVLAVARNRWLSDGFKEIALTTAVWSIIKAKRRCLEVPDGFMCQLYGMSEHVLPVLVWGALGPDAALRDVCRHFKAEVCAFLTDVFSFHRSRYTNVDELSADIFQHIQFRINNITQKMSMANTN